MIVVTVCLLGVFLILKFMQGRRGAGRAWIVVGAVEAFVIASLQFGLSVGLGIAIGAAVGAVITAVMIWGTWRYPEGDKRRVPW